MELSQHQLDEAEGEESRESTPIREYTDWRADKKLTNTPTRGYANTTEYRFQRQKIHFQDRDRDDILKA